MTRCWDSCRLGPYKVIVSDILAGKRYKKIDRDLFDIKKCRLPETLVICLSIASNIKLSSSFTCYTQHERQQTTTTIGHNCQAKKVWQRLSESTFPIHVNFKRFWTRVYLIIYRDSCHETQVSCISTSFLIELGTQEKKTSLIHPSIIM